MEGSILKDKKIGQKEKDTGFQMVCEMIACKELERVIKKKQRWENKHI